MRTYEEASESYTGGGKLNCRVDERGNEPVREMTWIERAKARNLDRKNLEQEWKAVNPVDWKAPEMIAKAKEAGAHHDKMHGDNSSDYDDD